MKFGKVDFPEQVDFSLPPDQAETKEVLAGAPGRGTLRVYLGCAKWNRQELRNFYPRGTRKELPYYATQFNAIELNATFYRVFPESQYRDWVQSVPETFRFFPKVLQNVTHLRRLNAQSYPALDHYLEMTRGFGDRLGACFAQLHPDFTPKYRDRLLAFLEYWPSDVPMALELRHPEWFVDPVVRAEVHAALRERGIAHILSDTAGRRDVLHMRLTTPDAFIRFVAANHPLDYDRLDAWVEKIGQWTEGGLRELRFFIHQKTDKGSPLLAAYFADKLNERLGMDLKVPKGVAS